jgi:Fe-S cluster assembly protein SufD
MSTSVVSKTEGTGLTSDLYLRELLKQCEGKESVENIAIASWIKNLRQQANSQVLAARIPNKKDEEWRFTDLSALQQITFKLAEKIEVSASNIDTFVLPETQQSRVIFVNGYYAPELSDVSALPEGTYIGNLANLSNARAKKIVKYLAQQEDATEVFTALNTAGLTDVAIVWVDANVVVETPVQILFLSVAGASPSFTQPRLLVVTETGASVALVEHYGGMGENEPYFTNAVTEIWVGDNAEVKHSRIQQELGDGFHIAKTAIAQSRDSRYTCNEISLGAKLYRNNLDIFQQGEQTETNLNGLIVISGEQLADTHSAIFLTKPYGTTDQLHKCIVDGNAQAVFNGKVFVPKAAQMTNAAQLNRNLLLSEKARVNTKPELQITADQVKCSHGATVSQLEADEVFYLRSRGLTEFNARRLLVDAFAAEILERISIKSLHQNLTRYIAQKVKS